MITHTKPHPEIFLLTAQLLKADPHTCLVFEDAEAGVEAAHAARKKCVGVGAPGILAKADWVITNTADFDLNILDELRVNSK